MAAQLQEVFQNVFSRGLAILEREIRHVANLKPYFVIMFSVSSFCNPAVYARVEKLIGRIEWKLRVRNIHISIKYRRLADFDDY